MFKGKEGCHGVIVYLRSWFVFAKACFGHLVQTPLLPLYSPPPFFSSLFLFLFLLYIPLPHTFTTPTPFLGLPHNGRILVDRNRDGGIH